MVIAYNQQKVVGKVVVMSVQKVKHFAECFVNQKDKSVALVNVLK
jgi:hypothetical protein